MFDVGFSEILVIGVVALLVLGPERLPKAARFAGLWLRRARVHWNSVKAELESELADEELRRNLRQTRDELHDSLHSTRELVESSLARPGLKTSSMPMSMSTPEPAATAAAPAPVAEPISPISPTDDSAQSVMRAIPRDEPTTSTPRAPHSDVSSSDG